MNDCLYYFNKVGNEYYIGEKITQEQHALQTAKFAKDSGADDEIIVAALFHDIGHLIGLVDKNFKQMEGDIGTVQHERVGASYLLSLGFTEKVAYLVQHHVDAKRYLCYKRPSYHEKLSDASKKTLKQQGGPMNKEEATKFERNPLFETIIMLRTWEEKAKEINPKFDVPVLESYRSTVERVLKIQRNKILSTQYKFHKLTEDQLDTWSSKGYLHLKNLLSKEMKKKVISWIDDIQNWTPTPNKYMVYYEKGQNDNLILCRTENFLPYHDGLRNLLDAPGPINDVLLQLLNEKPVLFKEKINYKLPYGGGFPAHQDAPAFSSFGQLNHLTLYISVDKSTIENGCLSVAPAHHKKGLLPQDPIHHGLSKDAEESLDNWIQLETDEGDCLFFSSWLPHRSGPNTTNQSRRALYITYNGTTDGSFREKYYEIKRIEFPQLCERDPNKDYSEGAKVFNLATPIVN